MTPKLRALPDPEKAKPCVLVIDDDDAVALAIAARLGRDFHVVGETDPAQAVEAALRENPGVILCDINMPGLQGDEVAFNLSEHPGTADIPLIYLTSLVAPNEEAELDGLFGDYTAISKGASADELRLVVEQALGLSPGD